MSKTFPKGLHPHGNKELSESAAIRGPAEPKTVYIPVAQHMGAPAEVCVEIGQTVKRGELVAKASGAFSANIFASVPGKVTAIADRPTVTGEKVKHIVIENDFSGTECRLPALTELTSQAIIARVREAGIVGLGGAGFPSAVKLSPPKGKTIDTLIINAAECEPYITCDYRIMLEYTKEFVTGAFYLAKALGLNFLIIGIEDNKLDAAEFLNKYLASEKMGGAVTVELLKAKYPQGAEKQLICAITGREVPAGGLPADVGVIVHNVHTALSTYYAIAEGQTLYKRVMTVTGRGAKEPLNIWAYTGTLYSEIISFAGFKNPENLDVFARLTEEIKKNAASVRKLKADKSIEKIQKKEQITALKAEITRLNKELKEVIPDTVTKVINGGPMMGESAPSLEISTTKTTSCLLLLTGAEQNQIKTSACINCCKCAYVCPMRLMPMYIEACTLSRDYAGAKFYGAVDCINCGCCAYICPAKRQLVQSIKLAKKAIKEKGI